MALGFWLSIHMYDKQQTNTILSSYYQNSLTNHIVHTSFSQCSGKTILRSRESLASFDNRFWAGNGVWRLQMAAKPILCRDFCEASNWLGFSWSESFSVPKMATFSCIFDGLSGLFSLSYYHVQPIWRLLHSWEIMVHMETQRDFTNRLLEILPWKCQIWWFRTEWWILWVSKMNVTEGKMCGKWKFCEWWVASKTFRYKFWDIIYAYLCFDKSNVSPFWQIENPSCWFEINGR